MEATCDKMGFALQQFPNLAKSNPWLAPDIRLRNMANLSLEIHLI
jgi:hypothetical protein